MFRLVPSLCAKLAWISFEKVQKTSLPSSSNKISFHESSGVSFSVKRLRLWAQSFSFLFFHPLPPPPPPRPGCRSSCCTKPPGRSWPLWGKWGWGWGWWACRPAGPPTPPAPWCSWRKSACVRGWWSSLLVGWASSSGRCGTWSLCRGWRGGTHCRGKRQEEEKWRIRIKPASGSCCSKDFSSGSSVQLFWLFLIFFPPLKTRTPSLIVPLALWRTHNH